MLIRLPISPQAKQKPRHSSLVSRGLWPKRWGHRRIWGGVSSSIDYQLGFRGALNGKHMSSMNQMAIHDATGIRPRRYAMKTTRLFVRSDGNMRN